MRRGRTRKQPETQENVRPSTRHFGATPAYGPLSDSEVTKVIGTAISLMASSGIVFEPGTEADDLLRDAGCTLGDDGIVKIPEAVTQRALETVARKTVLYDRNGENPVTIDNENTIFMPGMTNIGVYDDATGEPRPSTREDLAAITRLSDGLPNIDMICVSVKNVADSTIHGEIDEFLCMMENTTKPLEYLCEYPVSLDAVIEMATAVRGSADALRDKPYFFHLVTPLPVSFAQIHIDQILSAVRAGVPVGVGTLSIGGASSPITLAGCLVHCLMTDFAAIVLGQLAVEGSFCMGGSDVFFMEPATGAIGSFSQMSMGDMAAAQVRRSLGFPSLTASGGCTVARRFNQDAVWELSASTMNIFYHRPATVDYLGSLDQGLTFSEVALLFSDDQAGMLRKMWEGVSVTDEQIGTDLIDSLGPKGQYLAEQHTVDNCRTQVWNSRYLGPNIPLSNGGLPDQDLFERIALDLAERRKAPPPAAPDEAVMQVAKDVLARFREG
ncbi:Trimethylamine:corrinoid methyltransferase [Shimia gijangensis]|uniref:Trimethylamine:corrinoid methyltransferase n=1 Tax=Shimia gijangensis TaxID=1470563 RepID=A0A1M6GF67_9RHOB|nr:trimethylamine methyltransferase family protein [Shimia gijangensis]SHJ08614.1 Trimethylamine:corrinoid methyltransferase [Shimia gijangensis]